MNWLLRRVALASILTLIQISKVVAVVSYPADCSCGYSVNSTSDPEHAVFTEILETNFRHLSSPWDSPCWEPQVYNMTAAAAHGTYGKMATALNVVANPVRSSRGSPFIGRNGGSAGLQLWVNNTVVDNKIPMGEVVARDHSMVYGSFRVGMKVTNIPGTCSGFFWYRNDTTEIDMEFLSSQFNLSSHPIYLVMQTDESQSSDANGANVPNYAVLQLPFDPTQEFHEYRFDWTPYRVSFYADGSWLHDMDWTYPYAPGYLTLNHWSNGNMGWSQGPPQSDAVTTISYVKAYYNSSDAARWALYNTRCPNQNEKKKICQIPDRLTWSIGDENSSFVSPGVCGQKITSVESTHTHFSSSARTTSTTAARKSFSSQRQNRPDTKESVAICVSNPHISVLACVMIMWLAGFSVLI